MEKDFDIKNILTFKDIKKAKKRIGKTVILANSFTDLFYCICKKNYLELYRIKDNEEYCFCSSNNCYRYCYVIKENEK